VALDLVRQAFVLPVAVMTPKTQIPIWTLFVRFGSSSIAPDLLAPLYGLASILEQSRLWPRPAHRRLSKAEIGPIGRYRPTACLAPTTAIRCSRSVTCSTTSMRPSRMTTAVGTA
jgi:hypothetical protein